MVLGEDQLNSSLPASEPLLTASQEQGTLLGCFPEVQHEAWRHLESCRQAEAQQAPHGSSLNTLTQGLLALQFKLTASRAGWWYPPSPP